MSGKMCKLTGRELALLQPIGKHAGNYVSIRADKLSALLEMASYGREDRIAELRAVFEAACVWRDASCSRFPECDGDIHDAECLLTHADQCLIFAIDAARKDAP